MLVFESGGAGPRGAVGTLPTTREDLAWAWVWQEVFDVLEVSPLEEARGQMIGRVLPCDLREAGKYLP